MDADGGYIVIELKRGRAPNTVVTQTKGYVAWVKRHLAEPEQSVKGLIVARSFDNRLYYNLVDEPDVEARTYEWQLKLHKYADPGDV